MADRREPVVAHRPAYLARSGRGLAHWKAQEPQKVGEQHSAQELALPSDSVLVPVKA